MDVSEWLQGFPPEHWPSAFGHPTEKTKNKTRNKTKTTDLPSLRSPCLLTISLVQHGVFVTSAPYLCWSTDWLDMEGSHRSWEFMTVTALPCPEDSVS